MRGLLVFCCRAFPSDHRARRSDEVVDTALLAADGSAWRGLCESSSLVAAGMHERLRAESHRSAREGFTLLSGSLALVNLAVALGGLALCVRPPIPARPDWIPPGTPYFIPHTPYVVDWWWVAFAVAAAGIVLGLWLGNRWLAIGAAFANLCLMAYDARFLADNSMNGGGGHLDVFTHDRRTLSFPAERQWLAVAVVLAVATAATPRRRHSLRGLLPALVGVVLLVVLSRELAGGFFFLLWPLLALIVLAMTFGAVAPRLAVLTVGLTLAAVPAVDTYLTERGYPHSAVTTWGVAVGLFLAALLPLARLARRRLA